MTGVLDALLEGHVEEAFAAGGAFNPAQHGRGYHGMFIATGSQGAGVKRVQGAVGAKQDGQYGPQTQAKIRAYQQKHGLKVDGVIGRQTAASLLGNTSASKVAVGSMTAKQVTALGAKLPKGASTRSSRTTHHRTRSSSGRSTARGRAAKPPANVGGGALVG